MSIQHYLVGALSSSILTASMIAFATQSHFAPVAPPPMRPIVQIFNCDDVPAFNPEEFNEIRALRQNCEAGKQALVLIQTWERDPTAGQVLDSE